MLWEHCRDLINKHVLHGFTVPSELDAITGIDAEHEIAPDIAGLGTGEVNEIWQAVEELFRSGMHPMVGFCLRRHGQTVLNRSIGYLSGVQNDGPLRTANIETPVCLFSASKVVSALLVHKLAEDGFINLLDPISYYIPEFGAHGKGNITIYQLLSHRAGVPILDKDIPAETLFDPEQALSLIYDSEPVDLEGRTTAYHTITSGFVIAKLIEVTTGGTINEYLDKTIRKPMGMKYFHYGVAEEDAEKVPLNYLTGLTPGPLVGGALKKVLGVPVPEAINLSNTPGFLSSVVPSANLYATAEEACRFFQMLLDHGEWQGKQILQPLTVHRATRETGKAILDKNLFLPMRYSAGMMLGGSPAGIYGLNSHYAYGHIGFSNILCWADPQRDLSVALLTSGKPVLGSHLTSLPKVIHLISKYCEPCVDMVTDEPHYVKKARRPATKKTAKA